jgi:hypothetical protein
MREDGCVMPWYPTHGVEASSSRVALPAPDGTAARPEQERERASAPPAHFSEAQAEQALWQESRDHDASLNNTLNEALWVCRAYSSGTHARKKEDGLLLEFPCNPIRTRSV